MNYKLKIKNLDCTTCAAKLENLIEKIPEVDQISINFLTEKMYLECQEQNKMEVLEQIKKIIKKQDPNIQIEE